MSSSIRGVALCGVVCLSLLAGCGGGVNDSPVTDSPGSSNPDNTGPPPNPAETSSSFAQQCSPDNILADTLLRNATLDTEKRWLRTYFDEAYLWREEVPAVDPGAASFSSGYYYTDLSNYFDALLTPAITESGARRDQFSFMYPTQLWQSVSENATAPSHGIEWLMASPTPPRGLRIAYIEPGSPADVAGFKRGDTLVSIDDVSADAPDADGVDVLNAGLFPEILGVTHNFILQRGGAQLPVQSLTSTNITNTPVPQSRVLTLNSGARAGYIVFNDHVLPAEGQLVTAISNLRNQNVSDLVLDLRYNGGGFLFIAAELATMIAGSTQTAGKTFETLQYNARRSAETQVTPFYGSSCFPINNECSNIQPLPTLNLKRVYVLAQSGTCSASEALINGLRGVDVEVILIGGTTCGKPYGFTAKDNCGISYFPIEFAGINAKGFGDYADGFTPGNGPTQRYVPGCSVPDDLDHALGDPQEGMLAAAMNHISTGLCPAQPFAATARKRSVSPDPNAAPLTLRRNPARNNRLLLPH